jgi:hypothetical protein
MYLISARKSQKIFFSTIFLAALCLNSCAVNLISTYDETTDKNITALQKKTEEHLVNLESTTGLPECKYKNHKKFYDDAKVALSAISVRAAAIPNNEITTQQTKLLSDSIVIMEKLHKTACLSSEQITAVRNPINSNFTAILKLELAKRRGK